MKILIADKFEQSGRDGLQVLGCEISFQPDLKDEALVDAIAKAHSHGSGHRRGQQQAGRDHHYEQSAHIEHEWQRATRGACCSC